MMEESQTSNNLLDIIPLGKPKDTFYHSRMPHLTLSLGTGRGGFFHRTANELDCSVGSKTMLESAVQPSFM